MQLSKGKVAVLNYTLADDDGNTLDESHDGSFSYLHGAANIIPALERALDGKQPGDTLKVVLEAKDGYGERDLSRIRKVPRSLFPPDIVLQPGMTFAGHSGSGERTIVKITAVEPDNVVVDANHPLAGMRLHFDLSIVDVRDASEEELTEGRIARGNGSGG